MNTLRIAAMVALAGAGAGAADVSRPADYRVSVCVGGGADTVVERAEAIAGEMFAAIDVSILWRHDRPCPAGMIHISFTDSANCLSRPEVFAYALPYGPAEIQVFTDRLRQYPPLRQPAVLAHVFAHEITHVLEGVSRHSESGVMMAHWGPNEYNEMIFHPLPFADADVVLIHNGLAARPFLLAARR